EDLAHVLLADLGVDRVHDHAGTQRAPEDHQRLDRVLGEYGNAVAVGDALTDQKVGEAPAQRLELTEGDARVLIGARDEDLVRPPPRVLLEQRVDVDVRVRFLAHRGRYCSEDGGDVKESGRGAR